MMRLWLTICLGILVLCDGIRGQQRVRARPPQIMTPPGQYEGEVWGSVTLPCVISNLGRKSVFWMKGTEPDTRTIIMQIRSVRRRLMVPRQFQPVVRSGKMATEGTNLIINNLTPQDADNYTCTITWARQTVTHSLTVLAPQAVTTVEVTGDPPSRSASVQRLASATFSCRARGNPQPYVTWHKEGSEGEVLREGEVLTLREVEAEDAGNYVCVADNGLVPKKSLVFTLQVEYVEVEVESRLVVVDSEERRAQLTCRVRGHPEPQVVWYHNRAVVDQQTTPSTQDLHHLYLGEVRPQDLGEYQCYVYAQGNHDSATVTLTAAPAPALVLSAQPHPQQPSALTLTWQIDSMTPLAYSDITITQLATGDVLRRREAWTGEAEGEERMQYSQSALFTLTPGASYGITIRGVTTDQQQGRDMDTPYVFTVPESAAEPLQYQERSNEEETWKILKATLNILSRLPKVMRVLQ